MVTLVPGLQLLDLESEPVGNSRLSFTHYSISVFPFLLTNSISMSLAKFYFSKLNFGDDIWV